MCRRRPGQVQVNLDRAIGVAVNKIMPEARVARPGVARPGEPASSGSLAEAVPASKKRPRPPEAGADRPEAGADRPEAGADRPEAGADSPEAGVGRTVAGVARPPQGRELVLMTFGTRTLAQIFPRSPDAQLIRDAMWPRSTGHRGRTALGEEVARRAVLAAVAPQMDVAERPVMVTFIRCLDLHWPRGQQRSSHVGSHPEIMWSYAHHDAMRDIARQCWAFGAPRVAGSLHVIAFWCNAGEHRSVCAAELLSGYLNHHRHRAHWVFHACRQLWGRRSCGGCRECDPHIVSARRKAARARFAALMDSYARPRGVRAAADGNNVDSLLGGRAPQHQHGACAGTCTLRCRRKRVRSCVHGASIGNT